MDVKEYIIVKATQPDALLHDIYHEETIYKIDNGGFEFRRVDISQMRDLMVEGKCDDMIHFSSLSDAAMFLQENYSKLGNVHIYKCTGTIEPTTRYPIYFDATQRTKY